MKPEWLYRYIKVPNEVYEETEREVEKYRPLNVTSHEILRKYDMQNYPATRALGDLIGFPILGYRIFFLPPLFNEALIHIDAFDLQCAFNVPIERESIIEWFTDHPSAAIRRLYPDGTVRVILAYEEEMIVKDADFDQHVSHIRRYTADWRPTFGTTVNRAMVLNTHLWHRPRNLGNKIRALYSFVFAGNPKYEQIVKAFADKGLIDETSVQLP